MAREQMSRVLFTVSAFLLVVVITASAAPSCAGKFDAVSRAVLGVTALDDLKGRLRRCCPEFKTQYDVAQALFERVARGAAQPIEWDAVFHLHDIGDGAWFLEYQGYAFSVMEKAPLSLHSQFIQGHDRVLLLATEAFQWAQSEIDTGPGCNPAWQELASKSDNVLRTCLNLVRARNRTYGVDGLKRHSVFTSQLQSMYEDWMMYRHDHDKWCKDQEHKR